MTDSSKSSKYENEVFQNDEKLESDTVVELQVMVKSHKMPASTKIEANTIGNIINQIVSATD